MTQDKAAARREYMREYMRARRANANSSVPAPTAGTLAATSPTKPSVRTSATGTKSPGQSTSEESALSGYLVLIGILATPVIGPLIAFWINRKGR